MKLASLFRRRGPSRLRNRARTRPTTRLTLEALEDRTVPSGVDVVSGDPKDWPSYNHDPADTRYNPAETQLRPDNVADLETGHGQANQVHSRPMNAHGSGQFTDAVGGFFATGIATHLGAFTHYGTLILTPTDDPVIFRISGTTTYEAANGDKLYAVLDAQFPNRRRHRHGHLGRRHRPLRRRQRLCAAYRPTARGRAVRVHAGGRHRLLSRAVRKRTPTIVIAKARATGPSR
ncbi:MAG: hypothetical protein L0215_02725 [Gemmataceae bacterium]|nr:hypothetical protein [Gemmataceae bacterium]